jgi:hypothetical protein
MKNKQQRERELKQKHFENIKTLFSIFYNDLIFQTTALFKTLNLYCSDFWPTNLNNFN